MVTRALIKIHVMIVSSCQFFCMYWLMIFILVLLVVQICKSLYGFDFISWILFSFGDLLSADLIMKISSALMVSMYKWNGSILNINRTLFSIRHMDIPPSNNFSLFPNIWANIWPTNFIHNLYSRYSLMHLAQSRYTECTTSLLNL